MPCPYRALRVIHVGSNDTLNDENRTNIVGAHPCVCPVGEGAHTGAPLQRAVRIPPEGAFLFHTNDMADCPMAGCYVRSWREA